MKANATIFDKGRAAIGELAEAIEHVRKQIQPLAEKRATIEAEPIDLAGAVERLDAWLDTETANAIPALAPLTMAHGKGKLSVDWSKLTVAAVRPSVRAIIVAELEQHYATAPGISADSRKRTLAGIDKNILELELAEEALIRGAEQFGLDVLRRADADPRAVLAAHESLPT